MLSDNIRKYRKSKQMSQDELAEKLEVTRQSISLWETGQTQPSLDNIVALAKLFDVSTDALLTDNEPKAVEAEVIATPPEKTKSKKRALIVAVCFVVVFGIVIALLLWKNQSSNFDDPGIETSDTSVVTEQTDLSKADPETNEDNNTQLVPKETQNNKDEVTGTLPEEKKGNITEPSREEANPPVSNETDKKEDKSQSALPEEKKENITKPSVEENIPPVSNQTVGKDDESQPAVSEKPESAVETPENNKEKDLYGYLKGFVIENGIINGDYCYYSKDADNYGGYASERFSLYYWADSEQVEFCLHSVMDDTFSINFYLYVPKQHTGSYEYISSYYYRDTGEPLYEAKGVIKADEFTKNYPLNCVKYIGSTDVQSEFMEMSRQGICDLIDCLKNFVAVEKLEYSFDDFGFVNF